MCGIAGIIGGREPADTQRIKMMTDALSHRGPDDSGSWSDSGVHFGHRRLSIIDLSDAGHQPMVHKETGCVMIYNGEIYNYLEVKRELEQFFDFKTDSDSEVLLCAYLKWGKGALEHLRGMFAFVIYDPRINEIFIARDRFGIKPLYYTDDKGRFLFASEIKALLMAGIEVKPNMGTIGHYLRYGLYDHEVPTFFEGIQRLMPGHFMRVSADGKILDIKKYYDVSNVLHAQEEIPFEQAKEQFLETAREAVCIHTRADVDVGVNISGGVDSSAILALSKDYIHTDRLHCFSKDYKDEKYAESYWVKQLIDDKRLDCHFCLTGEEECLDAIDGIMWHQDEPFSGIPVLAWHSLFQYASDLGIKVLLDGSGVDDFTAGYQPLVIKYLSSIQDTEIFEAEAKGYCHYFGQTPEQLKAQLDKETSKEANGWLNARDNTKAVRPDIVRQNIEDRPLNLPAFDGAKSHPLHAEMLKGALYAKLPRALRFKDRNSMAFSIELRVPFLDHKIFEEGFKQPASNLIRGGQGKYIMREAMRGILPDRVRAAPKRTVQAPQREWFTRGPFAQMLEGILDQPGDLLSEVINIEAARAEFEKFKAGDSANANFLWQWVNLDYWHKTYFEGKITPPQIKWPKPVVEHYAAERKAA